MERNEIDAIHPAEMGQARNPCLRLGEAEPLACFLTFLRGVSPHHMTKLRGSQRSAIDPGFPCGCCHQVHTLRSLC